MTGSARSLAQFSEAGVGQAGRYVHVRVIDDGRRGEGGYRADDRDQRHENRQSGGDAGQVERQPGPAGHHQVPDMPSVRSRGPAVQPTMTAVMYTSVGKKP